MARSRYAQQLALPRYADRRMSRFDPLPPFLNGADQIFF
jgi:hypothetical protein